MRKNLAPLHPPRVHPMPVRDYEKSFDEIKSDAIDLTSGRKFDEMEELGDVDFEDFALNDGKTLFQIYESKKRQKSMRTTSGITKNPFMWKMCRKNEACIIGSFEKKRLIITKFSNMCFFKRSSWCRFELNTETKSQNTDKFCQQ